MPIDPDDPGNRPDLTPYQRAESWLYMMWMDVYRKCMAMIEQKIIDAGGGGKHSVAVGLAGVAGSITVLPPGPYNAFNVALSIKRLYMYADDAVNITFGPGIGTYDLPAGGVTSDTGLSVAWGNGTQLTWSLNSSGAALSSLGWTIEAEE